MANFNIDADKQVTYDAIVIGSGISGGWAAKELCENGLKTLVLERGRMVRHITDYPTMNLDPWDMEHGGATPASIKKKYPKQSRWGFNETRNGYINNIGIMVTWLHGYINNNIVIMVH